MLKAKAKGTAVEPPAEPTPTGGASGAAVSGDEPQQPATAKNRGNGTGFGDGSGDAAVGDGPAKGQTQGKAPGKGSKPPCGEQRSDQRLFVFKRRVGLSIPPEGER